MSLDNLQDIRFFNQVVLSQGFTAAAYALQMPVNMVSRRVASLEGRLGVRLLNRTTRKISLTAEGELLYQRSKGLLEGFELLQQDLTKTRKEISGNIRIAVRTTTIEFGFINDLSQELKKFEHLKVQLIVSDGPIDLIKDGIDLALMINELPDSSLVQKKLGDVVFCLCATQDYLQTKKPICGPEDLAQHNFISPIKGNAKITVTLRKKRGKTDRRFEINPQFQSNDIRARAAAIYAGLGIGNLPEAEVIKKEKQGKLVRVLPEYVLRPIAVWAVKLFDKKNDPRLRLIEELLIKAGKRMTIDSSHSFD